MNTELETAIKHLAKAAITNANPDAALKFTQAALNLAHVQQIQKSLTENK